METLKKSKERFKSLVDSLEEFHKTESYCAYMGYLTF